MSTPIKNAETLLGLLQTDEAFAKRLESLADSPEELARQLAAEGYQFTGAELREALNQKIRESQPEAELSEEQLKEVAGGININVVRTILPYLSKPQKIFNALFKPATAGLAGEGVYEGVKKLNE